MTRVLLGAWVAAWGLVGVAPPPALAQEAEPRRELTRAVGVSVSPFLRLYEYGCCSGIGVWLQVGRFEIDHSFGVNIWTSPSASPGPYGHATTALFDVKTWRTRDFVARFRIGGSYRVRSYAPTHHWGTVNIGVTYDFAVGERGLVRAGFAGSRPLSIEPQLGAGWRF